MLIQLARALERAGREQIEIQRGTDGPAVARSPVELAYDTPEAGVNQASFRLESFDGGCVDEYTVTIIESRRRR